MNRPVDEVSDTRGALVYELPDGFQVRSRRAAGTWNGFPVPVLGLTDALRVCLHVSEDGNPYHCSPLTDGDFAADGLQWQRQEQ